MRPKMNIFKKILSWFKPVRVNDGAIRFFISVYSWNNEKNFVSYITDVKAHFKRPCYLTITITSHRPGVLIGKKGETVYGLQEYLSDALDGVCVEIDVKESEMFKPNKIQVKHDQTKF